MLPTPATPLASRTAPGPSIASVRALPLTQLTDNPAGQFGGIANETSGPAHACGRSLKIPCAVIGVPRETRRAWSRGDRDGRVAAEPVAAAGERPVG